MPNSAPPSGRTSESHGRLTCLQRARGRRHLWGWHDCAHRAGRGNAEERSRGSFDERHSRDEPERQRVCQNRRGEPADSHGLYDVGDDHHALAIPTVRGNACEDAEERSGEEVREPDDARLRRGMGEREHEQRIGDRARRRAGRRQQLAGLQQDEVPVAAERDLGHRADDSDVGAAARAW